MGEVLPKVLGLECFKLGKHFEDTLLKFTNIKTESEPLQQKRDQK